jgi:hypothetical protein
LQNRQVPRRRHEEGRQRSCHYCRRGFTVEEASEPSTHPIPLTASATFVTVGVEEGWERCDIVSGVVRRRHSI